MNEVVEASSEGDEEITYQELLASLVLSGEVSITIDSLEIDTLKVGLRNLKAKQLLKQKEAGLPTPQEILDFKVAPSNYEGCSKVTIFLKRKGSIRVKEIVIPDSSL